MRWYGLRCAGLLAVVTVLQLAVRRSKRPTEIQHPVLKEREDAVNLTVNVSSQVILQEFEATASVTLAPVPATTEVLTTEAPTTTSQTAKGLAPCYVRMSFCRDWEGLAGTLRYNQHILAVAVKYGCAYVCEAKANWKTASHDTGAVDDLFGCGRDGAVGPHVASLVHVAKLPRVSSVFHIDAKFKTRTKTTKGVVEPLLTGAGVDMKPKPLKRAVYTFRCPTTSRMVSYEATSPWLREQYAAARLAARRPLEWSASKASWRIAMQLRRGDRAGTCPLGLYLNALRYLLKAVPFITSDNAEIILVGELDPSTAEFRALRRLGVEFLAGKKTHGKTAKQRLARDLDHISTSNVLILGGGGGFSGAAGALQVSGVVLHARTSDLGLDGLPHAHRLDDNGRFVCAYDLSGLVRETLGDPAGLQHLMPASAQLLQKVEASIEEYKVWLAAHAKDFPAAALAYEEPKACGALKRDPLIDPAQRLPL